VVINSHTCSNLIKKLPSFIALVRLGTAADVERFKGIDVVKLSVF